MAYNAQLYQANPMNSMSNGQIYPNTVAYGQAPVISNPMYQNMNITPLPPTAAYVQSEIEASSFVVGPGNTVVLLDSKTLDSDNPIMYVKTMGYDGKVSRFKKITGTVSYPNDQGLFTPIETKSDASVPEIDLNKYADKSDLDGVNEKITRVTDRLDELDMTITTLGESISDINGKLTNMFSAVNGNSNNPNDNRNNQHNNRKGNH